MELCPIQYQKKIVIEVFVKISPVCRQIGCFCDGCTAVLQPWLREGVQHQAEL